MIERHAQHGLKAEAHLYPPVLIPGASDYLEAFWELNTDRPVGATVGAIPFTAIDCYARRHGYADPDEFGLFLRLVRAMDGELRKLIAEKYDKAKPQYPAQKRSIR